MTGDAPDNVPGRTPPPGSSITRVARTYYALNALFTLSASLIWGVNTLFLLDAGLSIFLVFAVNAAFSAGQIVFEVPTGVIADTIGRRVSFLLGIASLAVATLGYVGSAAFDWGLAGFIPFSILLGFGFTCQTGAVDAWMVDALDANGFPGHKDRIFARAGVFMGISMLAGTLGGGLLGQLDLALPYLVRTGLLAIAFVVTFLLMFDLGFEPRPLKASSFGEESRRIFRAGITYGWRHPVVRPLVFTALLEGVLIWYLFYAAQPYALELLGRENLVWVAGLVTAIFALSGVAGNVLVDPLSKTKAGSRPALVLAFCAGGMAVSAIGMGLTGLIMGRDRVASFAVFAALLLVFGLLSGILTPVRQAFLNEQIPSPQRATVLSFDSLFQEVGAVGGQLGLGYAAQTVSKAAAYLIGGAVFAAAAPLYRRGGRKASAQSSGAEVSEPYAEAAAGGSSVTENEQETV